MTDPVTNTPAAKPPLETKAVTHDAITSADQRKPSANPRPQGMTSPAADELAKNVDQAHANHQGARDKATQERMARVRSGEQAPGITNNRADAPSKA